ncbi:MAG: phage tail sheath protein [Clostridia bacterium]|nr:phage tail sheath protein [Clostridia bacterium]
MGLPKILIEFKTLAETIITRSERGIVAVILKDNSNTTETHIYNRESEIVKSHFTASNLAFLQLIFMGSPSKVIVERIRTDGDIGTALERLKNKQWYYLTVPQITSEEITTVVGFTTQMRNLHHKTFKAVLPNCSANFEGIINFATDNIKVGAKTYTTAEFCARIAGILAGLPLNRSATYYTLSEVESITESETPDTDVDNGKLILINDGTKIKIARGVNSLVDFNENKGEDFAKIKIVEAVDMIRDDIRNTFEDEFVGKVENSYDNKIVFIAAVNKYFKDLAGRGVLYDQFDNKAEIDLDATREWLSQTKDVSAWEDERIKTANTGTNVFVKANIQIQDAIEDLNFRIYIE